jgi:hypothetical protein
MSVSPWTTWLTQALEDIYQPSDDSEFGPRFYSIFTPQAEIIVNHDRISVSALEDRIKSEAVASNQVSGVKVDWKETFDVPETNGEVISL